MTVSQKMGSPGGSDGKESACRAGHPAFLEQEMATHASILAWRIPVDGGAWLATVHGIVKSQDCEKYRDIFKTSTKGILNPMDSGKFFWHLMKKQIFR